MARKKGTAEAPKPGLFDVRTKTAPCVPAIREKVQQWSAQDWPGVTETTRTLLNFWFRAQHRPGVPKHDRHHDHDEPQRQRLQEQLGI